MVTPGRLIKQDILRCPYCGSTDIVFDSEYGQFVCRHCGSVIQDHVVDLGPEWRAFNGEEAMIYERAKPISPALPGHGPRSCLLLLAFLVGFAAPTAGLAQVRAQTPSLIALPRSETVYMGGAVWGPITSLNPFSPSNGQLDDYLQSMVYLPLFLFSPVTGSLYPALGENFTVTSVTAPASPVYGP